MSDPPPAALHVVATPLGNLRDISARALDVLAWVTAIYAEDTRHSRRLLQHFGITTPLVSLHEHNEDERAATLIKRLQRSEPLALISDAGTPCISDPGHRIVAAVHGAGLPVLAIPGPSATIAALSVAGLPTDRFLFIGFLPARGALRRRAIAALATEPGTLVIYESPRRVARLLDELNQALGARPVVLARELTKVHEELIRGTLGGIDPNAVRQQGEFTVLIGGAPRQEQRETKSALPDGALRLLDAGRAEGLTMSATVRLVQAGFNLPRRIVYQRALEVWDED